mmetsp:Transcript_22105/g.65538  ORF Transcript_22105/g.65538 Transcript_22105/m.65538 type:complete len:155 (-) Transcript_22105:2108-2572(-)
MMEPTPGDRKLASVWDEVTQANNMAAQYQKEAEEKAEVERLKKELDASLNAAAGCKAAAKLAYAQGRSPAPAIPVLALQPGAGAGAFGPGRARLQPPLSGMVQPPPPPGGGGDAQPQPPGGRGDGASPHYVVIAGFVPDIYSTEEAALAQDQGY